MSPLKLRLSVAFLISLILIPPATPVMIGCSWWEPADILDTSMFIPEMILDKRFDPFFLSIWDYYESRNSDQFEGRYQKESPSRDEINILEWQNYFSGLDLNLLNRIVYSVSDTSIDTLIWACRGKLSNVPEPYRFASGKKEYEEAFQYLKLAKRIEKATYVNPWSWDPVPPDSTQLVKLADESFKGFKQTRQRFLKMRYGFQFVRCCFGSKQYQRAVDFARKDYPFKPDEGYMYYRTHGYEAACLYKLKRFGEANLWFARLYDMSEGFKFSAFESFHPLSETEWLQSLQMAETTRDKELLWHLLGVYADPLRGMKEIAKINSESDLLPLLLVRAVNIAENNMLSNSRTDDEEFVWTEEPGFTADPAFSWRTIKSEQIDDLTKTIESISENRQSDKALWCMAAAFSNYLKKDFSACLDWTSKGETASGANSITMAQGAINRLLIGLEGIKTIRPEDEANMFALIQRLNLSNEEDNRQANALRFVLRRMKALYEAAGDDRMAELAFPDIENYFQNDEDVQGIIDFKLNPKLSSFHQFLANRYPLTVDDLYDVQGVVRIYSYDFEGALEIYKKVSSSSNFELLGNPFNYRIVDCHDCDHQLPQRVKHTKRSFVEKMIELKKKGDQEKNPQERANNYFLYANGLYNMTWYGNGRLISVSAVNWNYSDSNRFSGYNDDPRKTGAYYDCSRAEEYYLKALALSPDKEFRAKCMWMAAKCEHNRWLETDYNYETTGDFVAGEYFKLMKETYQNTKYYTEVIEECGYFCQYITPGFPGCIKNKDY